MKIEIVFEDHTRQMQPKRYLVRLTDENGRGNYVWVNSGTVLDTRTVSFLDAPTMPELPKGVPGNIYPWMPMKGTE